MKTTLLILAIIVFAGLVTWVNNQQDARTTQPTNLPWQIEITEAGTTQVLGVEVGATTLAQATKIFQREPEIGLFMSKDSPGYLEVYFGKVKTGPIEARLIARLAAEPALLEEMAARATDAKPMPSGSIRYKPNGADTIELARLKIVEMSYSPIANTESDNLKRLFGAPESELIIDATSRYWLYPSKGLVILMDQEGKEIFHYFPPDDFPAIEQRMRELVLAKPVAGDLP